MFLAFPFSPRSCGAAWGAARPPRTAAAAAANKRGQSQRCHCMSQWWPNDPKAFLREGCKVVFAMTWEMPLCPPWIRWRESCGSCGSYISRIGNEPRNNICDPNEPWAGVAWGSIRIRCLHLIATECKLRGSYAFVCIWQPPCPRSSVDYGWTYVLPILDTKRLGKFLLRSMCWINTHWLKENRPNNTMRVKAGNQILTQQWIL